MAFKTEISFQPIGLSNSITLPEAYVVIDRVDVLKTHSEIHLSIYESLEGRNIGLTPVIDYPKVKFSPELDANEDIYKLAYKHLKTVELFKNSIDC